MPLNNVPPVFRGDVQSWATQLVEYLRNQNEAQRYRAPQPVLLSHLVGEDGAKAAVDGMLMYEPVIGRVSFARAGGWENIPSLDSDNSFNGHQFINDEGFGQLAWLEPNNTAAPKKVRIEWLSGTDFPQVAINPGNPTSNAWDDSYALRYSYDSKQWTIGAFGQVNWRGARIVTGNFNGNWANTDEAFLILQSGTVRLRVLGNGDVRNQNNSYGGISDAQLKENIEDASSKLSDVSQLRVVNFNLIGDDIKQIGLVAQEVEQVFPSLVTQDESGYKGVKYSVLVPILIKALQELTKRVEALEGQP